MSTTRHLLQNAVFCPEQNKWYKSGHVHDFVTIDLGDCKFHIDGGPEYLRYIGDIGLFGNGRLESWNLYSGDPWEKIADRFLWGTLGPGGKGPRKWVPIKDLSLDHLLAIRKTQPHIRGKIVEEIVNFWIVQKTEPKE